MNLRMIAVLNKKARLNSQASKDISLNVFPNSLLSYVGKIYSHLLTIGPMLHQLHFQCQ